MAEPSIPRTSDEELVHRIRSGDDDALAALYDRHADRLFTVAHAVLGNDADAAEVTEDVFLQLWNDADAFDPERGSLRAWLSTMARTRGIDRLRAEKRRRSAHERAASTTTSDMAIEPSNPGPADEEAEMNELRSRLGDALSELNPDQKAAIELAYFGGFSQSEIARKLEEPLGTIKTRIRDGMKKLRQLYPPGTGRSA